MRIVEKKRIIVPVDEAVFQSRKKNHEGGGTDQCRKEPTGKPRFAAHDVGARRDIFCFSSRSQLCSLFAFCGQRQQPIGFTALSIRPSITRCNSESTETQHKKLTCRQRFVASQKLGVKLPKWSLGPFHPLQVSRAARLQS